jgi:dethiobiotin synthetase
VSKGIVITGTDTGVGKTVVSAALALTLRRRGLRVGVLKPVESGCPTENGRLQPRDALTLREASGCTAPLEVINPYALAEPLAPALAAARAGVFIDLGQIERCFRILGESHDVVLVEGAGGLLSPLGGDFTLLDLAARLRLPVLVIAANVLGAINHTALTVGAIRQRGLSVLGVILNNVGSGRGISIDTNEDSLRRWGGAALLGTVPYAEAIDHRWLEELGQSLPVEELLGKMMVFPNA